MRWLLLSWLGLGLGAVAAWSGRSCLGLLADRLFDCGRDAAVRWQERRSSFLRRLMLFVAFGHPGWRRVCSAGLAGRDGVAPHEHRVQVLYRAWVLLGLVGGVSLPVSMGAGSPRGRSECLAFVWVGAFLLLGSLVYTVEASRYG